MEMETEDDIAMEGEMHASSSGAVTVVTDELQLAVNDDVNVEVAVVEREEITALE